ncbi:MAG: coenzyme F420-0:L-glutamate ligase, partial [Promethearchaeota archaeon]
MKRKNKIGLFGITGIPLIKEGDNIAKLIIESLNKNEVSLDNGDILVIAQIIVSKSLGLIKDLKKVKPSQRAIDIYHNIKNKSKIANLPIKNPELIQAILDESKRLIKSEHVLITETKHGFICADAGIDKSNVEGNNNISLLPHDPDKEAKRIRQYIQNKTKKQLAVIISDSFGRSFRIGSVGTAIGVSGISPLLDKRGEKDLYKRELKTTIIGQVDS